jgi:nanoRNase/pAp phosphatase (c-di-AMP/oligoRNAs hydrolase)
MLKYFEQAFGNYRQRGSRLYAFLGPVPTPDILVILADFLLRLEEISWTIVGGLFEDKLIVIFRNHGLRANAGRLAVKAFGKLGSAGGHAASARAEVPLENCKIPIPKDDWQQWQDFIIKRVES